MPYILNTEKVQKEMLKAIGRKSMEELYRQIPFSLRLNSLLDLAKGLSEYEVKKHVESLCARNKTLDSFNSFLGAGSYDHYLPAALPFILSRSEFLTAYTPYQAECSQGILQAIYEYQTYMCLLTGMDVSNASLLDGASSLAEAVLMALRITQRKKVMLLGIIHPEYKQTLKTYLSGYDFTIKEIGADDSGITDTVDLAQSLDEGVGCCVVQSPNFFGLVEDIEKLAYLVKEKKSLLILATNPLSLAIFKEPAKLGVDIVCGDGQPLGGNLNFGGPSFGFLAAKREYLRQMPGRIVGKTLDKEGRADYCLTLQTREQHIRREKATSNICSNQSLNTLAAAVYLSLLGEKGLKDVALFSFSNAQYLYQRLSQIRGINIPYPQQIFNEFLWEVEDAENVANKLYQKNIIAGYLVGKEFPQHKDGILSCCTEKKAKEDIDVFANSIAEILHG